MSRSASPAKTKAFSLAAASTAVLTNPLTANAIRLGFLDGSAVDGCGYMQPTVAVALPALTSGRGAHGSRRACSQPEAKRLFVEFSVSSPSSWLLAQSVHDAGGRRNHEFYGLLFPVQRSSLDAWPASQSTCYMYTILTVNFSSADFCVRA